MGDRQGQRRERSGASPSNPAPTPAGRAPTGSRTSCFARRDPTSTTAGSPASTKWTRPAIKAAFEEFGKVLDDTVRRRDDRQQHELRRRRQPAVHRPARLPVPPPGKLHHRLLQGAGRRRRRRLRLLRRCRTSTPSSPARSRAAGDLFGLFSDKPAAKDLLKYLTTAEAQQIWVDRGGFTLGQHQGHELSGRSRPSESAERSTSAKIFRFDGGDLMPNAMKAAFFRGDGRLRRGSGEAGRHPDQPRRGRRRAPTRQ